MNDSELTAASSAGPYWPDDDIALAVWSAIGCRAITTIDEEPEDAIARMRGHGYTYETACEDIGLNPNSPRAIAVAAAWAGIARIAAERRDAAVRWCHASGAGSRELARATGLSSTTAIRRILER